MISSLSSNQKTLQIPNTVFFDDKLAILESVVEYLKDEKKLNYRQIGELLNRDERNIWTVYSRVRKKRELAKKRATPKPTLSVPLSILEDRSLSGFEAIVEYLKEKIEMNFHDIGLALNRDERNVWTVYHRSKEKRNQE